MANFGDVFDTSIEPEPARDFEALPPGTYTVHAVEHTVVHKDASGNVVEEARDGIKSRLTYEMDVLEGPMAGRKFWVGLGVRHPSPQHQGISITLLHSFGAAVGVSIVAETQCEELLFKPCLMVVGLNTKDKTRTEAKVFKPLSGVSAPPAGKPAASRPAAASAETRRAPWPSSGAAAANPASGRTWGNKPAAAPARATADDIPY